VPVEPEPTPRPDTAPAAAPPASRAQLGQIRTALKKRDLLDEAASQFVAGLVGHPVGDLKNTDLLSRAEADQMLTELRRQESEQAPEEPCAASQRDAIGKELKRLGWGRDDALGFYTETVGHTVDATIKLTISEARQVMAALRAIDAPLDGPMFPEGDQA
jgi:hypothetical protein